MHDQRVGVELENPAVRTNKTAHEDGGVEFVELPRLESRHVVGANLQLASDIIQRLALRFAGTLQLLSNGRHTDTF